MAIPSQARKHFREGVETRRAAPKPRAGNGEGIVQTTNPHWRGGESRSGMKIRRPQGREGSSPSARTNTFHFLVGDCGKDGRCRRLPVDAYYREHNLVIEYRERQHSEPVTFMNRRQTISGCSRGEQRRRYDERRREVLTKNAVILVELDYAMFSHNSRKRLRRTSPADEAVIRSYLTRFLKVS
jgi:hypothetical protein